MAIDLEKKLKELSKPLAKSGEREGGKSYWTIEQFRGRMDEVFGPSGYSMEYDMMPPYEFPVCKQVLLTCHCTIRIYDEGKVIYSTMGIGCKEVQRLSKKYYENNQRKERAEEERTYMELNNAAYSLQLNAFKNACKSMNIFGCNTEEDSNGGGSGSSNNSVQKSSGGNLSASEGCEIINFYIESSFKQVRKDGNTGKPVYELEAYKMIGEAQYDNTVKHTIVFYPNKYRDFETGITDLLNRKKPYVQKFLVKKGSQGGYIFNGFGG